MRGQFFWGERACGGQTRCIMRDVQTANCSAFNVKTIKFTEFIPFLLLPEYNSLKLLLVWRRFLPSSRPYLII